MRGKLFSRSGKTRGTLHRIADEATLGRSPDNTVPLKPKRISARHARITLDPENDCYLLEDLGSTNGTELDGSPVHSPERLGHLHVITLAGEYDFIFQDLHLCARRHRQSETAERAAQRDTGIDELPPALPAGLVGPSGAVDAVHTQAGLEPLALPEALGNRVQANPEAEQPSESAGLQLLVTLPEGRSTRVPLLEGDNVVGRAFDAQIQIDRREVSRRHAVLTVRGERVQVRDEGSANHTYVNGQQIDETVEIGAGARLRFGTIEAELVGDQATGERAKRR